MLSLAIHSGAMEDFPSSRVSALPHRNLLKTLKATTGDHCLAAPLGMPLLRGKIDSRPKPKGVRMGLTLSTISMKTIVSSPGKLRIALRSPTAGASPKSLLTWWKLCGLNGRALGELDPFLRRVSGRRNMCRGPQPYVNHIPGLRPPTKLVHLDIGFPVFSGGNKTSQNCIPPDVRTNLPY